ncbi:MAG: ATP-binding protein [Hydrogenophaga sp.]|jgi:signal transduction histidine kinase/CheY-like chemotaxis protein|nr:ATP-binding protein [Hydrogenophaga sp.]
MPTSPDRLAQDLQRSLNELQQERERTQQLLAELERQNHELDRLRSSIHRESNSRLLAEEALDETRDRLQLAVEAAGLALWDWQLTSRSVFLSARWGELIGDVAMDAQWDLDKLHERVHPDDLVRLRPKVRGLLDGTQQREVFQHRVRRFDGWVWVETHAMVAEQDKRRQPLRLMGTVADIGDRKRAELETAHAREMAEQASRAKSAFLANMSHEVRTPLNALMGLTRMLMDSPLNEEQRGWLALMDSSANALLALLNDILDLSRIEAGKLGIEQVRFELRPVLEAAVGPYAGQAKAKPLAFSLEVDPGVPIWIRGDPGRLRQVLGNLLSNALKFTPKNGSIQVQVRQAGELEGVPLLQFAVRDSGVGISRKQQTTIFDAFTQADVSTSRRYGGSGLGLAICDRLARLMGGRIELQSELGQGSLFTLVLPLPDAGADGGETVSAPAELEGMALAGPRYGGRVVLLAEDNPVNELMMRQMLLKLGFTVRVARGGAQAVSQWEQGGVDLVLMDVQMPGMSGLDATRAIRVSESRRRLPRTPIVAVTASAMPGDRQACLDAGMDGYTAKPVSPHALMREMDRVLARAAAVQDGLTDSGRSGEVPAVRTSDRGDAQPSLDLDKLRRRLDDDEGSLQELAQAMRLDLAERMQGLRAALERRDSEAAVAHAHGLKGSLGSMTAERGARLAKGLELAARTADWSLFERALPLMQAESAEIERALARVTQGSEPDLFPDGPLTPGS